MSGRRGPRRRPVCRCAPLTVACHGRTRGSSLRVLARVQRSCGNVRTARVRADSRVTPLSTDESVASLQPFSLPTEPWARRARWRSRGLNTRRTPSLRRRRRRWTLLGQQGMLAPSRLLRRQVRALEPTGLAAEATRPGARCISCVSSAQPLAADVTAALLVPLPLCNACTQVPRRPPRLRRGAVLVLPRVPPRRQTWSRPSAASAP